MKIIFVCNHCGEHFTNEAECKEHEKNCKYNKRKLIKVYCKNCDNDRQRKYCFELYSKYHSTKQIKCPYYKPKEN